MGSAYDKFLTAVERAHVHLLRFLTLLLTASMWLMSLSGGAAWHQWANHGFGTWPMIFLILFVLLYAAFQGLMVWLCLISRRLRIAKRILVWTLLWIPLVNLGLALYVRGLAKQEIDHTLYKIELNDVRKERQICATRYPILLVHGVGFRDFHYFNYWGRIPRELVRNGARVYYGHQEAWGTIEDNACILRNKILEIQKETGCGKVNIIAHSKGGLDSRYLISALGMEGSVASLTTICTPHRGSALSDFLKILPEPLYRNVCRFIDWYFRRLGDGKPNAYAASRQLSRAYASGFNRLYGDKEGVYYQSYASLMKRGASSKLLCVPYWILKKLDGPNDGLVTKESAQWGVFRGVVTNNRLRGISHGDMIDLTREDYKGFDVKEFYVELAADLKKRGF